LNKFEGLLFESIAAAYVSVTVGRDEKFAPACALRLTCIGLTGNEGKVKNKDVKNVADNRPTSCSFLPKKRVSSPETT